MSDELRRHALAAAGVGVWCWTIPDGEACWAENLHEVHGLPRDVPFGRLADVLPHVHAEDRPALEAAVGQLLAGARAEFRVCYRLPREGGSFRRIEARGRVVPGDDGTALLLGVFRDVTASAGAGEDTRQAHLDAVGRLSGGVAHEFNNLLTVISGYTELVLSGLPADSPFREQLREIREAGRRAAQLTAQLLAFGQRSLLAPRLLDLNAVVREAADSLRPVAGPGVRVVTRLEPDLPRVRVDPVHLHQALLDLAARAREAMPAGGELTLRTAAPAERNGPVLLEVRDTGPCLGEDEREHLFEPFHDAGPRPVGDRLRLAAVHGFVRQSGGRIEVVDPAGCGTAFRIYLPLPGDRPSDPGGGLGPAGDETVLVVEDEEGVRSLIVRVLRAAGYSVLEAASGHDALDRAGRHPGPIDLLLTDVLMPGMDGRDLAQRLSAARPGVKILFLSGYSGDATLTGAPLLPKPFAPMTLLTKLREVLRG
jgi:signal transduction histidine kinase